MPKRSALPQAWGDHPCRFSFPDGTGRQLTINAGQVMAFHPNYAEPDQTTLVLHGGSTFTVGEDEAAVTDILLADNAPAGTDRPASTAETTADSKTPEPTQTELFRPA